MICATYVNGDGAAESLVHCQNWGFLQNFPPMEGYEGQGGFLALLNRLGSEGGIQAVVVHRLAEVPDLVWLMKELSDRNVYLVSLADEIDTRPFDLRGAGQGRVLRAVADWAGAIDARFQEEEEAGAAEGESKTEPPLRAMTGKEIKRIKEKLASRNGPGAEGEVAATGDLMDWVCGEFGVSAKQAQGWLNDFV